MQPCTQSKEIKTLEINQAVIMEKLNDFGRKIDDMGVKINGMYEYIFEGGLDSKYARKESVARLWTIVRSVIGFICLGAGSYLATLILKKGG